MQGPVAFGSLVCGSRHMCICIFSFFTEEEPMELSLPGDDGGAPTTHPPERPKSTGDYEDEYGVSLSYALFSLAILVLVHKKAFFYTEAY